MTKLYWELKTILCDICKERPMKKVIQIGKEFKGVCIECEIKKDEVKNKKNE